MWQFVETIDDARVWCEICDLADPDSYDFTKTKEEHELRAKQILQYYADKPGRYEYWTYSDGAAQCALCVLQTTKEDVPYLEYVAYCAVGFAETPYENWASGYKVIGDICREIKDRRGIERSGGWVPMTEAGKCIVHFAESIAWEQDKLTVTPGGDTWRLEFVRDSSKKPEDEADFKKVKEPTVIPDTKP